MIYKWRHMKLAIKHFSGLRKTFWKKLFKSHDKSGKHFSGLKNTQVGKTLFRVEKYSSRENSFQGWKILKSGKHFLGLKNTFLKSLFKSHKVRSHFSGLNKTFLKSLFTSYEVRKSLLRAEKHFFEKLICIVWSQEITFQGWKTLFWKVCLNRVKSRENTFQGWKILESGKQFSGLKNTQVGKTLFRAEKHCFKKFVQIAWKVGKTLFRVEKHFFEKFV